MTVDQKLAFIRLKWELEDKQREREEKQREREDKQREREEKQGEREEKQSESDKEREFQLDKLRLEHELRM